MFIEIYWDITKQLSATNNKGGLRYQVHLFCCTRLYLTQWEGGGIGWRKGGGRKLLNYLILRA